MVSLSIAPSDSCRTCASHPWNSKLRRPYGNWVGHRGYLIITSWETSKNFPFDPKLQIEPLEMMGLESFSKTSSDNVMSPLQNPLGVWVHQTSMGLWY